MQSQHWWTSFYVWKTWISTRVLWLECFLGAISFKITYAHQSINVKPSWPTIILTILPKWWPQLHTKIPNLFHLHEIPSGITSYNLLKVLAIHRNLYHEQWFINLHVAHKAHSWKVLWPSWKSVESNEEVGNGTTNNKNFEHKE